MILGDVCMVVTLPSADGDDAGSKPSGVVDEDDALERGAGDDVMVILPPPAAEVAPLVAGTKLTNLRTVRFRFNN